MSETNQSCGVADRPDVPLVPTEVPTVDVNTAMCQHACKRRLYGCRQCCMVVKSHVPQCLSLSKRHVFLVVGTINMGSGVIGRCMEKN